MHPVTHLLVGWSVAEVARLPGRDRALVSWSCVVSDLDGAGMVVDFVSKAIGRPETDYYETFHRLWGHGLPAALVWTMFALCFATRKLRVALFAFIAFHLHFLMDILGSRGSAPGDLWPIHYLAPFSYDMTVYWSGQWPLTSWQNTTITVVLMIVLTVRAVRTGESPVILFSRRADKEFVATVRRRWRRMSLLLQRGSSE